MISKDTFFSRKATINCRGKLIDLSTPKVMGILNVTSDSFYDGGKYKNAEQILLQVEKMLNEGADFIDIGACSSRPGAEQISEEEELKKLIKAVDPIRKKWPDIILSIDTFRSSVAEKMIDDFNADIINDISAGELDNKMYEVISKKKAPYIIMHMKGAPQNMQENPTYNNLIKEIVTFFSRKVFELRQFGIYDVILDPGFGFGKTIEHNYELLARLDDLKIFELPVMVGLSRKSMIYKLLNTSPCEALTGTSAANVIALLNGANILRVHDVSEAKHIIQITEMYLKTNNLYKEY